MELVFNYLPNESNQHVLCTLTGEIYNYNNAPNHNYDPDILDDYFKSHNDCWVITEPVNGEDVDWYTNLPLNLLAGRLHHLSYVNGILSGTFDIINIPAGKVVAESFDATQLALYPYAKGDVDYSTGKVVSYDLLYFIVKVKHTGV